MIKLKSLALIITASLFIVGCDDKYSREWYIAHHEEMITKYTECLLDDTWDIQQCQNARDAMKHESDAPDVKKGLHEAREKVLERNATQPLPDLNLSK